MIIMTEPTDLCGLVNKLNNEEIVRLLEMIFANRPFSVFVRNVPERDLTNCQLDQENPVHLNGTVIQININKEKHRE